MYESLIFLKGKIGKAPWVLLLLLLLFNGYMVTLLRIGLLSLARRGQEIGCLEEWDETIKERGCYLCGTWLRLSIFIPCVLCGTKGGFVAVSCLCTTAIVRQQKREWENCDKSILLKIAVLCNYSRELSSQMRWSRKLGRSPKVQNIVAEWCIKFFGKHWCNYVTYVLVLQWTWFSEYCISV